MVNGDLLGRVQETNHWYKLSDGTIVSFHVAYTDKEREKSVLFVSDSNTWPSITAESLGITYTFMRNAEPSEIEDFLLQSGIRLAVDSTEEE